MVSHFLKMSGAKEGLSENKLSVLFSSILQTNLVNDSLAELFRTGVRFPPPPPSFYILLTIYIYEQYKQKLEGIPYK